MLFLFYDLWYTFAKEKDKIVSEESVQDKN